MTEVSTIRQPKPRTDPRTILCLWGGYVLFLASIGKHDLGRTLIFGSIVLFAATASGLPWRPFLRRIRVILPFLVFMFALNPWFEPRPLTSTGPTWLTFGIAASFVLAAKAIFSILAIHVVERRMPLETLCAALSGMGVPRVFVTQLLLLHRYGFLVAGEAESMRRARDVRSRGSRGRGVFDTARLIGTLFLRSNEHAQRIHRSMLARGFNGVVPIQTEQKWRMVEMMRVLGAVVLLAALRVAG